MITRARAQWWKCVWINAAVFIVVLIFAAPNVTSAQAVQGGIVFSQEELKTGQNVAPAFEGWEENPDGGFNMVFGYFNRNWEEQPHIPVGTGNSVEPGGPDRGQPTHFFPRRNKFVFRVPVPKDFGERELVWTLTVNGQTEKAYATLKPDYKIDKVVLQTTQHMLLNVYGQEENEPPVVELQGATRMTVKVGEPVTLSAVVHDDGLIKPRAAGRSAAINDQTALGLRVAWYVYRGRAGSVRFDPEQFKVYQAKKEGGNSPWMPGWAPPPLPPDGKFPVKVTFTAPGVFVVRVLAHDGGLDATKEVTVTVQP